MFGDGSLLAYSPSPKPASVETSCCFMVSLCECLLPFNSNDRNSRAVFILESVLLEYFLFM